MADLIPWLAPWSGRVVVLLSVVIGLLLVWRGLHRGNRKHPTCPRCEYNLTGASSTSCPECGHVPKREGDTLRRPRRYRLAMFGLIAATVLPAFVVQQRMRKYGADYYLKLYPLYWVFPEVVVGEHDLGEGFTTRYWVDRRERLYYLGGLTANRLDLLFDGSCVWSTDLETELGIAALHMDQGEMVGQFPQIGDFDGDGVTDVCLSLGLHKNTVPYFEYRSFVLSIRKDTNGPLLVRNVQVPSWISFEDADADGLVNDARVSITWLDYEYGDVLLMFRGTLMLKYAEGTFHVNESLSRAPPEAFIQWQDSFFGFIGAPLDPNDPQSGDTSAEYGQCAIGLIYTGNASHARAILREYDAKYPPAAGETSAEERVFAAIRAAPFGEEVLAMSRDNPSVDEIDVQAFVKASREGGGVMW